VIIAGNWKMFRGPDAVALRERIAGIDVEAIVCPPFTGLDECVAAGLTTFAQNVHWEREGAYTGEVSASMLLERGVAGSLVGHSERRQYFGETDETVALRTRAALDAGLRVIACIGETKEERDSGETRAVLRRQLARLEAHPNLVLAYEPVWAIGTGLTATPEMAQEGHSFIRSLVDVPVLYGGSCKPDSAPGLLEQSHVEGALVGGASLEIESFAAICETAARIRS
jgi:triosephosphate isomerase (TIM)